MPFQYFFNPKHTFFVHRFEEGKIKNRKSVNDYVGWCKYRNNLKNMGACVLMTG